jgi:hypothetical protein
MNPNDQSDNGRFCKKVFNGKPCGGVRVWEDIPKQGRKCLLCQTFTEESLPAKHSDFPSKK